jgi:hypothetical protein
MVRRTFAFGVRRDPPALARRTSPFLILSKPYRKAELAERPREALTENLVGQ